MERNEARGNDGTFCVSRMVALCLSKNSERACTVFGNVVTSVTGNGRQSRTFVHSTATIVAPGAHTYHGARRWKIEKLPFVVKRRDQRVYIAAGVLNQPRDGRLRFIREPAASADKVPGK